MRKVIARVKLNPGQGGYFDPITRIHLTHGDPERDVYAGMNTEGLKTAVRNKRISLVSGSLGEFIPPFKLIKQADGKVVLVANNQKKNIQPTKTVNKKNVTVSQKKEESTPNIEVEPTVKEQEIVESVIETINPVMEPVTEVTKSDPNIKVEPSVVPVEQEQIEEPKNISPFKKGKKNKTGKKDNEEIKTE